MLRLRVLILSGCVLVMGGLFVQAQDDDVKSLLRKSMAAHGGEKNLGKFKAVQTKFKGTITITGAKFDITGDTSLQKPDKVKNVLTLDIKGMQIEIITVFNGKKLWVSQGGNTKEIDDEKILNAAREEMQAEGAGSFSDYLKAPYELNSIGVVKVKGKDAVGIRISKKGTKDITMYLDKQTHLIVKTEMRTLDAASGQEILQEKYVIGYQDKAGMKVAKRVEIVKDGKTFMDIEILEVTPMEKFEDSVFTKP